MRVVVTAGYSRSLHAIALIERLAARGHTVAACLQVRVLSAARIRAYARQLGWRRMWRRGRDRLLRTDASANGETAAMAQYFAAHGIRSRNLRDACRQVGAQPHVVPALNDAAALAKLRAAEPDLIVYSGGGILRREFLSIPKHGVLNAHGGPLPAFRGMNAAEWALWHGVRPATAVHLVDEGIDTGPVLRQVAMPTDSWPKVPHGRGVATRLGVETLLDVVDALERNELTPTPQAAEAGRQFFVMAEPMVEVLEAWLAEHRTPRIDAADFSFDKNRARGADGTSDSRRASTAAEAE
jgi:methionyl-tRNA formyltransferase